VIGVNAFNLMDNLDGACGTVAAVAAAGVGVLAAIRGQEALAGLAFALSGACAGFLPWNLAGPAKIFLGDGGSMPVGFLVVALTMATAWHTGNGDPALLVGGLLAGLPIFDVALVSYSRIRRGVPLVTGGRDHLTHRLLPLVGSPRAVAGTVASLQAALSTLAIVGWELGSAAVAWISLGVFASGVLAIVLLDDPRWRPDGIVLGDKGRARHGAVTQSGAADSR
jgi:UDP-GlcNAc:undecaprenyl-phosphate GlcNAc-1-phosphate transferase